MGRCRPWVDLLLLPLHLAADDARRVRGGVYVDIGVASLQEWRRSVPNCVAHQGGTSHAAPHAPRPLTSNNATSCSKVEPARGPPMSAAVKLPVKARSPDCGGCSCGSAVDVAALPTPTGTKKTMTGPDVVALPWGGGCVHEGGVSGSRVPPALTSSHRPPRGCEP